MPVHFAKAKRLRVWTIPACRFLGALVFNLWHVIHRPFSYSFAILAILHIVVVLGMGYR